MTERTFGPDHARLRWRAADGYLDTANYGLPHVAVLDALADAISRWETGASVIADWIDYCDRARRAFASLVSVPASTVACSAATSHLVGLVASSLPDGASVLLPDNEFTSNVYPWLAQADRAVQVRTCAVEALPDAIGPDTDLVAFSLVQSSDGSLADLAAIRVAAARHGARVLVDATQACGWLDIDASSVDYVVCSAYKWLMAPRGCSFMSIRPERIEEIRPSSGNWFAGEEVSSALYGPPLRLARDARRFDLSPAWINWAGAAAALEAMSALPAGMVGAHDLGLAARFADAFDLPAPSSPIVAVPLTGPAPDLTGHGVKASLRGGRLRVSFHVHNTVDDLARLLDALAAPAPAGAPAPLF